MSDAHERLRQYLSQRKEMGESEFVLDSLSVEDALRVLTAGAAPPAGDSRPMPSANPSALATNMPRELPTSSRTEGVTEDWRAALAASDVPPAAPAAASKASTSGKSGRSAKAAQAVESAGGSESPEAPESAPAADASPELLAARTLDEVAAVIAACKACSLSATAINHVPGEGSPDAKFVVVGEAPGATEDELGRPFVGKSGDLLTKILDAVGFKREDVFICNVLKHRPPGNRNPTKPEIAACSPFLLRQLDLMQPRVILALGTFAAQTLLQSDAPIGKLRGLEHRYHGIPLVATYHPAALLRNPNWKRPAWEDVQLARRIFDRA